MPGKMIEMKEEQAERLAWLIIRLGNKPIAEGAIKAAAGGRLALACAGAIDELKFVSANRSEPELEPTEEQKVIKEINAMISGLGNEDLNALMGFEKGPE